MYGGSVVGPGDDITKTPDKAYYKGLKILTALKETKDEFRKHREE